jgi:hypothetical protein
MLPVMERALVGSEPLQPADREDLFELIALFSRQVVPVCSVC